MFTYSKDCHEQRRDFQSSYKKGLGLSNLLRMREAILKRTWIVGVLLLGLMVIGCQPQAELDQGGMEEAVELPTATAIEQSESDGIPTDQIFPVVVESIDSAVTGRDYRLTICLPMSYALDDGRDYSVIYVTDGDFYSVPMAMSAGQLAMGGEMPEVIVVGVDFGVAELETWMGLRWENMVLDGRDAYLQFFVDELVPYIEAQYRVKTEERVIAGHSSGGKFALYALLNGGETFTRAITSSPADAFGLRGDAKAFAEKSIAHPIKLFISIAEEDEAAMATGVGMFVNALGAEDSDMIAHTVVTLDNETHLSVRPRAFSNGLRWVYAQ